MLVELLREFHGRGWVSGTGGGICGPADDDDLLLAPTGVLQGAGAARGVLRRRSAGRTRHPGARPTSACAPASATRSSGLSHRKRAAWSVVHSHALTAVLAADLVTQRGDHLEIRDLEMLKGIPGVGNQDVHLVPVIRNTPREAELVEQLTAVFDDPRFATACAVLVRDHGAYIWGDGVWDAKRHTEVYHFLFEATVARRGHQRED